MSYEVEVKSPIADRAAVRRELVTLGAVTKGAQTEVDTYLAHPARSFAETDEALRVRQIGPRVFITYKGPKIDATTKTRTEIEFELVAPVDVADVIRLWEQLRFRPVRQVKKDRELLDVPWQGREVHACLDRVEGLGEFIELELTAEPAQLEESRQLLASLAKRLQLATSERRSYLELLLEKDARSADTTENTEDWSE
jgi:adenylate cyclase class 2